MKPAAAASCWNTVIRVPKLVGNGSVWSISPKELTASHTLTTLAGANDNCYGRWQKERHLIYKCA